MSNYTLSLDYQLAPGWLQPYTDGLIEGKALAWRCADCERTSFPPARTCTCGQTTGAWRVLTGYARVMHYTFGQDGQFALVRFDGADTSAVVRLDSLDVALTLVQPNESSVKPACELTGSLQPSESDLSELVLRINSRGQTT